MLSLVKRSILETNIDGKADRYFIFMHMRLGPGEILSRGKIFV